MKKLIRKIEKFFKDLLSKLGGSDSGNDADNKLDKPVEFLKSAMITPFFVTRDEKSVRNMAKQIKNSNNFNSICGLIDLQDGRNYIIRGRTKTSLNSITERNIQICIDEGVSPLLIIRNDWAVRRNENFYVPSAEGIVGNATFYNNSFLEQEKKFLELLYKKFGSKIDIQLSIEPNNPLSANFALQLGSHLRSLGFKYKIIVNPYSDAVSTHLNIKGQLDANGITISRSRNGADFGSDPIVNTDGNTSINKGNFKSWLNNIKATNRQYIIWTQELANTSTSISPEYLN